MPKGLAHRPASRRPSAKMVGTRTHTVLNLTYRRRVLHFWDLGGAPSMRTLWDQYLPDAHVLVWVLDAPHWVDNVAGDEGAYRTAACRALFRLVQEAAARNQPILVLVGQLDRLEQGQTGPELPNVSIAQIKEDVQTTLLEQWARLVDETPSAATLNPRWNVLGVSAASGYVRGARLTQRRHAGGARRHAYVRGAVCSIHVPLGMFHAHL